MRAKENLITAVIKRPGEEPVIDRMFPNELEEFQREVGGYIETVTVCSDLVLICNEEGRIDGLQENVNICGIDFVGTVIAVGVKRDEFASIQEKNLDLVC